MFEPHSLLLFVMAGLALNLTPGPDLLYITARSLGQGWRAGAPYLVFLGVQALRSRSAVASIAPLAPVKVAHLALDRTR